MCVSQSTVLLMLLFSAHSRKPASDTYLRDYLIGGVVWAPSWHLFERLQTGGQKVATLAEMSCHKTLKIGVSYKIELEL